MGSWGGPWASLGGPWGSLGGSEASLGIAVSAADSFVMYTTEIILLCFHAPSIEILETLRGTAASNDS